MSLILLLHNYYTQQKTTLCINFVYTRDGGPEGPKHVGWIKYSLAAF
jgi:hypothetical protein